MTPPLDLEELEKLAKSATPGEWSCGRDPSHFDAPELVKADGAFYVGVKMEDAAFIAAANPAAILALIARVKEAEAASDKAYLLGMRTAINYAEAGNLQGAYDCIDIREKQAIRAIEDRP